MNYAESTNLVNFYFNHELKNIDLKKSELSFNNNDIPFSALIPLADKARFIDLPAEVEIFLISDRASYTFIEKPSEDK